MTFQNLLVIFFNLFFYLALPNLLLPMKINLLETTLGIPAFSSTLILWIHAYQTMKRIKLIIKIKCIPVNVHLLGSAATLDHGKVYR